MFQHTLSYGAEPQSPYGNAANTYGANPSNPSHAAPSPKSSTHSSHHQMSVADFRKMVMSGSSTPINSAAVQSHVSGNLNSSDWTESKAESIAAWSYQAASAADTPPQPHCFSTHDSSMSSNRATENRPRQKTRHPSPPLHHNAAATFHDATLMTTFDDAVDGYVGRALVHRATADLGQALLQTARMTEHHVSVFEAQEQQDFPQPPLTSHRATEPRYQDGVPVPDYFNARAIEQVLSANRKKIRSEEDIRAAAAATRERELADAWEDAEFERIFAENNLEKREKQERREEEERRHEVGYFESMRNAAAKAEMEAQAKKAEATAQAARDAAAIESMRADAARTKAEKIKEAAERMAHERRAAEVAAREAAAAEKAALAEQDRLRAEAAERKSMREKEEANAKTERKRVAEEAAELLEERLQVALQKSSAEDTRAATEAAVVFARQAVEQEAAQASAALAMLRAESKRQAAENERLLAKASADKEAKDAQKANERAAREHQRVAAEKAARALVESAEEAHVAARIAARKERELAETELASMQIEIEMLRAEAAALKATKTAAADVRIAAEMKAEADAKQDAKIAAEQKQLRKVIGDREAAAKVEANQRAAEANAVEDAKIAAATTKEATTPTLSFAAEGASKSVPAMEPGMAPAMESVAELMMDPDAEQGRTFGELLERQSRVLTRTATMLNSVSTTKDRFNYSGELAFGSNISAMNREEPKPEPQANKVKPVSELEIASLRAEHQHSLNSALADAADAKANVDRFLMEPETEVEHEFKDAAAPQLDVLPTTIDRLNSSGEFDGSKHSLAAFEIKDSMHGAAEMRTIQADARNARVVARRASVFEAAKEHAECEELVAGVMSLVEGAIALPDVGTVRASQDGDVGPHGVERTSI